MRDVKQDQDQLNQVKQIIFFNFIGLYIKVDFLIPVQHSISILCPSKYFQNMANYKSNHNHVQTLLTIFSELFTVDRAFRYRHFRMYQWWLKHKSLSQFSVPIELNEISQHLGCNGQVTQIFNYRTAAVSNQTRHASK